MKLVLAGPARVVFIKSNICIESCVRITITTNHDLFVLVYGRVKNGEILRFLSKIRTGRNIVLERRS